MILFEAKILSNLEVENLKVANFRSLLLIGSYVEQNDTTIKFKDLVKTSQTYLQSGVEWAIYNKAS